MATQPNAKCQQCPDRLNTINGTFCKKLNISTDYSNPKCYQDERKRS